MIITKIKIILPVWNCKKCMVERKKWLNDYTDKNIDNLSDELILEFVLCKENSNDMNVRMMVVFKELMNKKFPKKNIKVIICP